MRAGNCAGRLLLILLLGAIVPAASTQTRNDQHLVLSDDDINDMREYDPAEVKASNDSLRDVEQRLEQIKHDAGQLQNQAQEKTGAVKQSQSALGKTETASSLLRRTLELHQRRIDALAGLISDLRQAHDESVEAFERRVALLYLARLQEGNAGMPSDAHAAVHRVTWASSAHYAAYRIREAEESARAAQVQLRKARQTLAEQQSLAETTQRDEQRLRREVALAEKSLKDIENQRREIREHQTVLESRQEALKDLLSLLEEKRKLQQQRQGATRPLLKAGYTDQHLVIPDDPAPTRMTPLPALPPAVQEVPDEVVVLDPDPEQPAIRVQTDGAKPVFVLVEGDVKFAGELRGFGQIAVLQHPDEYFSIYAHLGRLFVEEGETLVAGDVVGMSGNLTESRTGFGARFEVRHGEQAIDPMAWPLLPRQAAAALLFGRKALDP